VPARPKRPVDTSGAGSGALPNGGRGGHGSGRDERRRHGRRGRQRSGATGAPIAAVVRRAARCQRRAQQASARAAARGPAARAQAAESGCRGASSSGAAGAGGGTGGGGTSGSGPLPPTLTGLFPGVGASGVCLDGAVDAQLCVSAQHRHGGKISIFAASNPNTAVDSIDIAAASYSDTIGGQARNLVRPVFIDGNSAVVYLHQHKLAANTSYFVTVSSGTFVDAQKNQSVR